MGMIVVTLVPVGVMQAYESFNNGFWSARSLEFYQQPLVKTLLWLRMIPDTVFLLGALPIVAGSVYGLLHLRKLKAPAPVTTTEQKSKELVEV
jgi:nitric oxide reductase subunit B